MSIDSAYNVFMQRKNKVLNEAWNKAFNSNNYPRKFYDNEKVIIADGVKEDIESLRPYAIEVIKQPCRNTKDVLSKLAVLTIMLDDSDLPIGKAFAALFSLYGYRTAIKELNNCIEQNPKGIKLFISIRDDLIKLYTTDKNLMNISAV